MATLPTRPGGDGPLIDPAAAVRLLTVVTVPPSGTTVRDLRMGALIGRRDQLRTATGVLRRTPKAVMAFGVVAGVQLVGIEGIGKTAIAGRVMARLREDGWSVVVHVGPWTPGRLIDAVVAELPAAASRLGSAALDDPAKVVAIAAASGRA